MNASVPGRSKQSVELRRRPAKFPREARLLRHSDFDRVYKQGRRHFSASLTVFYMSRSDAEPGRRRSSAAGPDQSSAGLRVGFTVGRALGGAVDRNRMKRRLRHAVRLSWPVQDLAADVVINPKKSVLKLDFELLLTEVRRALAVVQQKLGDMADSRGKNEQSSSEARP